MLPFGFSNTCRVTRSLCCHNSFEGFTIIEFLTHSRMPSLTSSSGFEGSAGLVVSPSIKYRRARGRVMRSLFPDLENVGAPQVRQAVQVFLQVSVSANVQVPPSQGIEDGFKIFLRDCASVLLREKV